MAEADWVLKKLSSVPLNEGIVSVVNDLISSWE
jgi:hypothetical protein